MIKLIKEEEKIELKDTSVSLSKELILSRRYYIKILLIKIPVNQWLVNKILK